MYTTLLLQLKLYRTLYDYISLSSSQFWSNIDFFLLIEVSVPIFKRFIFLNEHINKIRISIHWIVLNLISIHLFVKLKKRIVMRKRIIVFFASHIQM